MFAHKIRSCQDVRPYNSELSECSPMKFWVVKILCCAIVSVGMLGHVHPTFQSVQPNSFKHENIRPKGVETQSFGSRCRLSWCAGPVRYLRKRAINSQFPCIAKNLAKGLALSEPPDMSRFVFPLSTPQQGFGHCSNALLLFRYTWWTSPMGKISNKN